MRSSSRVPRKVHKALRGAGPLGEARCTEHSGREVEWLLLQADSLAWDGRAAVPSPCRFLSVCLFSWDLSELRVPAA